MQTVYFFDLVGTFAFAVYGSFIAQNKKFDIFGIFVCAILSAIGGGTLRELILNNTPFYFSDFNYFTIIVIGVLFSIITYSHFEKFNRYMLVIDALGLATFAYIGAEKAAQASMSLVGIIVLATVTAVGGGILRDTLIREIPQILYRDFYAIPAVLLGFIYGMLPGFQENLLFVYSLIFVIFVIRLIAIHYHVQLWIPFKQSK